MRQRCEELLHLMISGEEELVLEEVKACATLLKGYNPSPHVASAADQLHNAMKMLHLGLREEMPENIITRLRAEAKEALGALVELGRAEVS
ncbi:MAG: hypothetical protein DI629_15685 [Mesorhizobium amorphae]|nr:MAG: hypothetical protein DI629_15685 [Mesorhizobium amorphae]